MSEQNVADKISLTELLATIRRDVAHAVNARKSGQLSGGSENLSLKLQEVVVETFVEFERTTAGDLGVSWGLVAVGKKGKSDRDGHKVVLKFNATALECGDEEEVDEQHSFGS